jgi:hypothetical protein
MRQHFKVRQRSLATWKIHVEPPEKMVHGLTTNLSPSDYLAQRLKRAATTSYLLQKYGIATTVRPPPELNEQELVVQESISQLLQLVEEHLAYWGRTASKSTTDSLIETKHCVLGLLQVKYMTNN